MLIVYLSIVNCHSFWFSHIKFFKCGWYLSKILMPVKFVYDEVLFSSLSSSSWTILSSNSDDCWSSSSPFSVILSSLALSNWNSSIYYEQTLTILLFRLLSKYTSEEVCLFRLALCSESYIVSIFNWICIHLFYW